MQRAMREIEKYNPKTLYGVFGETQSMVDVSGRMAVELPQGALFRNGVESNTLCHAEERLVQVMTEGDGEVLV